MTTGFLGSYTTFSTYELDAAKLLQESSLEMGLVYYLSSSFFALISLLLGNALAEFFILKKES
ncbi:MAG: fluoride efflux transporter FluC [Aulosira sp. ZfuVER01]|nr:CrcB family protein [Aulosira sp. ZfuVER01]MDZ7997548.1 CrcB family protein [Aulosira sp. DedVER01a]MDZ8055588.1 CrcB family protein [Aulosira sp. ZfuCHP01]